MVRTLSHPLLKMIDMNYPWWVTMASLGLLYGSILGYYAFWYLKRIDVL